MKKLFTLLVASGAMALSAQTIIEIDQNLASDYAAGAEIDWDNDGLKELYFGGLPQWQVDGQDLGTMFEDEEGNEVFVNRTAWKLKWDGTKYVKTQVKMLTGVRSSVIPADFNGDGNIDLYLASGGDAWSDNGIYLNDGAGNFTKWDAFKVYDREGNELNWLPRTASVADFNADGLLDIVGAGWWLSSDINAGGIMNCGVLINEGNGVYRQYCEDLMGNGDFVYAFALCIVTATDLNNDGYADFMVQGNVDNPADQNTEGLGRTMRVYLNLGAETEKEDVVAFYDLGLNMGEPSHNFGNGNFEVADFNNDGMNDIFVTGESPDDAVSGWDYFGQLLLGRVASDGSVSYTDDQSFVARAKDIRPLNANASGTRAIDYNADGYYDLFLYGWCPEEGTQAGWFLAGSAAGLTTKENIPGASEQGIFFLDYGVENALNECFTGYHGDARYFDPESTFGRSMVFTKNASAVGARPDAPTDATVTVGENGEVTLSWKAATSSMKNVTYEYYLKNKATGLYYTAPLSFVGGERDGQRKALRQGNAFLCKKLTLTLPDGLYEFGVQTIAANMQGSVFTAPQTFTIGNAAIQTIEAEARPTTVYNLMGQPAEAQGLCIVNGRIVLRK